MNNLINFGIYIIGDEILSGKRQDAHLSKAIEILTSHGLQLSWAHYLGDEPAQITSALKTSFAKSDIEKENIVFSFGGIGATPDDYTRAAVADALNLPIERHEGAVAEIEAQFGEAAYPKRVLMADFPKGAQMIPNPFNRVAGFAVGLNQQPRHYFLPGFPSMAWPMMEWVLDMHYAHIFHQVNIVEAAILVRDAGESQLIDLMNSIVKNHPDTKLFSLPRLAGERTNLVRTIELGVKGAELAVRLAIVDIKAGVTAAGFDWSDI